jgi:hypothetical protein
VLVVVAACIVVLWRRFIRWHSRLQIALKEVSDRRTDED